MPNLIPSGATALEVCADAIAAAGYAVEGSTMFLGLEVDGDIDKGLATIVADAITVVTEADGVPYLTYGLPVALENPRIQVITRGAPEDYPGPKQQAMRIRYHLASLHDYTSRGVTLHAAVPLGSILPLGKDANGRHRFSINFTATTSPSYQ
ncbi:minor capsid protein [Arthrobacter phage Ottawa]|nr:minor capsid protein [Arthrobacter phage Kharcho]WIC89235.1 minor capsid protein [Arthrobacter phage Ottawa]